jgi:tight adherence protein B
VIGLLAALVAAAVLLLAAPPAARLDPGPHSDAGPAARRERRVRGLPTPGLLAARRRDRAAADVRRRVIDLCDALEAELAAGQTSAAALDHAAAEWPHVTTAARAAATGGDVPAALRSLAALPGAEALRVVAAAWQVAHRTGHGLADVLGRVAADLRAAEQTRRIVAGELASARATARLLAGLPLLALLLGSGAGADPWQFLLRQPLGLCCLAAGLAFGYAGLAWIESLARNVDRVG